MTDIGRLHSPAGGSHCAPRSRCIGVRHVNHENPTQDQAGELMKIARQTVCFFLTLVGVLFFWNVIAAKAQMTKVRPDPLMEKADVSSMNTGIAGSPAGSPVMTEDGPVRGTNVFGVLGYLGIPY